MMTHFSIDFIVIVLFLCFVLSNKTAKATYSIYRTVDTCEGTVVNETVWFLRYSSLVFKGDQA